MSNSECDPYCPAIAICRLTAEDFEAQAAADAAEIGTSLFEIQQEQGEMLTDPQLLDASPEARTNAEILFAAGDELADEGPVNAQLAIARLWRQKAEQAAAACNKGPAEKRLGKIVCQ